MTSKRAIHPGEILVMELEERGMTQVELARLMDVPQTRVNRICKGMTGITANTAARFERVLGTSAQLWMEIQNGYEMTLAEKEHGAEWDALKPANG